MTAARKRTRAEIIMAVLTTMRQAALRCADPLQVATAAFPQLPPQVIGGIHELNLNALCDDESLEQYIDAVLQMRDVTPSGHRR
jgi:hypothetical protein